jgi:hypothetical protein
MGLIQEGDVGKLLQDPALMDDVVKALVEDSDTLNGLADDIADKLQDALQEDPAMRKRIVDAAVANSLFKQKIVNKLVEDMK